MQPLNRTRMATQYRGKWVALKDDRQTVVASGKTVKATLEAARQKGYSQPIITRMPTAIRSFVGGA